MKAIAAGGLLRISSVLMMFCFAGTLWAQADFGEVAFVNSGAPAAQPDFLRGLAMLHDFEYDDATQSFRKVEEIDPGFAMAYWGEAMTKNHPIWHEQDLQAGREVLARLGPTAGARLAKAPTVREKMYLASLDVLYGEGTKAERDLKYEAAMGELHNKFPDDVDATSFYALAILGTAEEGRDFATYMRAAAVLEEIFPTHPTHPGTIHYLIHSYDDPIHAPLGLRPARIYAKVAPAAGHAQHMTSHIFLALGMWDDVVAANEKAAAVVNERRAKAGKQKQMCGHYNYWLEYGYLQQGRVEDARRMLEGCRQQALSEDAKGAAVVDRDRSSVGSYAAMRARFLIDTQLWSDDVVGWTMPAGEFPAAQLTFDYATALAELERGDKSAAPAAIARVRADRAALDAWLDQHKMEELQERTRARILTEQLEALSQLAQGQNGVALQDLRRVAAEEKAMPVEFGPPFVDNPTDELVGEALLKAGEPADARVAFQSALAHAPGRRLATAGLEQATASTTEERVTGKAQAKEAAGAAHHH